jgi:carboxymethylenebutenolidase
VKCVTFDRFDERYAAATSIWSSVAVLKGEGRVPILFGSWALPVPPNRSAYIARPDAAGEHPTVVLGHDESGITPGLKAVARHLARHGYSAILPDLVRPATSGDEFEWTVSDLADAVDSARIPGTDWASQSRIAILGLGAGGVAASIVAADERVSGLVLVGAVLDHDLLAAFDGRLLVLHGTDDEMTPVAEVRGLQESVGRGEWVIYSGVGSGFLDEGSPGFNAGAATDALERTVAFLDDSFLSASVT